MNFKLTILGSNSALPTPSRFSTSQLLQIDNTYFLIDCAEGTQIRLKKVKVSLLKINHIFISHLHADHFLGILGVLSSLSLLGRKTDLHIYAHQKLSELIEFYTDFIGKKLNFNLVFHFLSTYYQVLYEDKNCRIFSFPLHHGKIPCCGFLFKTKERLNIDRQAIKKYKFSISWIKKIKVGDDYINPQNNIIPNKSLTIKIPSKKYAYCGDTIFCKEIVKYIIGVNMMYHEATFSENEKHLAKERYHSTSKQAATIAKLANTKKLLIGHFSGRFKEIDALLKEAKEIFPNTIAVRDGEVFKLD